MRYVDALQAGTQVGQYAIEEVLGQGGFGIVYRARHPIHGVVALKEFFPKSQASRVSDGSIVPSTPRSEEAFAKGVEKLIAEGDKLKGLKHDNIVDIIEVFEYNHTAYLVMEDVGGLPLQAAIDEKKLVASKDMVESFAKQMISALALVHSAGLIHRDIAPDNILVDMKGGGPRFVLIDFGGAKRVVTDVSESSSRSLTKTGFSSPEQYGSESAGGIKATPASDVYGLAATLYWLISGRKPIDAPNRHVQDTLVPLAGDDALEAVYGYNFLSGVDHGLSMRPDARPESVQAFQRSLEKGVARKGLGNGDRSKWLTVALSVLVIGALGLGGFGYTQGWFSPAAAEADAIATEVANSAISAAPETVDPASPASADNSGQTAPPPVAVRTDVVKEPVEIPAQAEPPPKPRCHFETRMRSVTKMVAATAYRDEAVERTDSRSISASGTWNIPPSMIAALNSGRLHVVDAEDRCDSAVKSRASSRFRSQCYGGEVTDEEEPPLCTCNADYSGTCSWESSAKCEKTVNGGTRRVPYETQRQVVEEIPEQVEICD